MHMHPSPQLRRRRKFLLSLRNLNKRQWLVLDACTIFELTFLQRNEGDPRRQPMQRLIVFARRVTPRKILVVKIDVRKIVRLEISDPIARLGLEKRTLLNANDIARPVQLNLLWNCFGRRGAASDRLTLEC